jgi:hypothetical protein
MNKVIGDLSADLSLESLKSQWFQASLKARTMPRNCCSPPTGPELQPNGKQTPPIRGYAMITVTVSANENYIFNPLTSRTYAAHRHMSLYTVTPPAHRPLTVLIPTS